MTKAEKSAAARALNAARKTHGGPQPLCHPDHPDPDCPRCKKRLAMRAFRRAKKVV